MVSEHELKTIDARYASNPHILFGKILERHLTNPKSEYGFFQKALKTSITEFFTKVFNYRKIYGFGFTGTCTIPGTPVACIPKFGVPGSKISTSACITKFILPVLTDTQIDAACKDQTVGYWGGIFELMGKYFMNTTVIISAPSALGLFYTTSLRTVYPALSATWLSAGIAFGKRIIAQQINNHDYLMMLWSEELNRLIKTTTGVISFPAWPVMSGTFSGTITASWFDFNTQL